MNIKYWMNRRLYGIEEWEHCECEYCKNKRQIKKDNSPIGIIAYLIRSLWESRITWFLIGVIIASLFR